MIQYFGGRKFWQLNSLDHAAFSQLKFEQEYFGNWFSNFFPAKILYHTVLLLKLTHSLNAVQGKISLTMFHEKHCTSSEGSAGSSSSSTIILRASNKILRITQVQIKHNHYTISSMNYLLFLFFRYSWFQDRSLRRHYTLCVSIKHYTKHLPKGHQKENPTRHPARTRRMDHL